MITFVIEITSAIKRLLKLWRIYKNVTDDNLKFHSVMYELHYSKNLIKHIWKVIVASNFSRSISKIDYLSKSSILDQHADSARHYITKNV